MNNAFHMSTRFVEMFTNVFASMISPGPGNVLEQCISYGIMFIEMFAYMFTSMFNSRFGNFHK